MALALTPAVLAEVLRRALLGCGLDALRDPWRDGQPLDRLPSVDLAVVAFPASGAPVAANVLLSRELPQAHVVALDGMDGGTRGVQFLRDLRDDAGRSLAWLPGSDWRRLRFSPLHGEGEVRFVSPYPASLVKLMVAVGAGLLVDERVCRWSDLLVHGRAEAAVADWCEAMLVASDNDATEAMVGLLHRHGLLGDGRGHGVNRLHEVFERRGLHTLRLESTTATGGWRNADGAGVGALHMTAWDTVRLLWLLLPDGLAPSAAGHVRDPRPLLSAGARERLWAWLGEQGLHEVLSSGALAGVPGWERGIAARLPRRWIAADGSVAVQGSRYPADVRPERARCDAAFSHKTGTTENYASDAGWVQGDGPRGRRYLVALLSSVGSRFAPHPACATAWCLPRLGRLIDDAMRELLER